MSTRKITRPCKPKPWGGAHQREALRRTYEIAAQMVAENRGPSADRLALDLRADVGSEQEWVRRLLRWSGLDSARIDREVRRVHALAEGRLVRDRGWRVGHEWYAEDERTLAERQTYPGRPLLRVTRIRRAP